MYLHFIESVGANILLQQSMTKFVWLEAEDFGFRVECFKEQYRYPDVASAIKDKGGYSLCHEKVRTIIKNLLMQILKPPERAFTSGARCRHLKIENTSPHAPVAGITYRCHN